MGRYSASNFVRQIGPALLEHSVRSSYPLQDPNQIYTLRRKKIVCWEEKNTDIRIIFGNIIVTGEWFLNFLVLKLFYTIKSFWV